MRKLVQTIVLTLLATIALHAQDTVFRKDGKTILCKIQSEDSTKVTFQIKKAGQRVITYLNKEEVDSIKYGIIPEPIPFDKASIGFGMGMDYGGFGANVTIFPQQNIGLFAGFGYAMIGLGYNVGVKYRYIPNSTATILPYAIGMYGYNTAIKVENAIAYNKFFYGATVGVGLDFHSKSASKGYWSIAILVPIRGSEVNNYINDLKNSHGVEFKNNLSPIGFSIGYKIILN